MLELLIGWHLHDALIRPYGGDALSVILLYAFLRAVGPAGVEAVGPALVLPRGVMRAALISLGSLCSLEFAQYMHFARRLGLAPESVLSVVMGTHFDWFDFAAYACGFFGVLCAEVVRARRGPFLSAQPLRPRTR
jgi:hypothetical protein